MSRDRRDVGTGNPARGAAPSAAPLSRRALLAAVTALFVGALGGARLRAAERASIVSLAARVGLPAADAGKRYVAMTAAEADVGVLADRLAARLQREDGELSARLAAAVREDFRLGDVVSIDGWLCSRTEARVCAIAYLASRSA